MLIANLKKNIARPKTAIESFTAKQFKGRAQNGKKYLNGIGGVRTHDIEHTLPTLRPLGYRG